MNEPYVKQYNEQGICINPVDGIYPTFMPTQNRQGRREVIQKRRFFGNGKNTPLVVGLKFKYKKVIQLAVSKKDNRLHKIEHYILVTG